jgi:hypothetical protein
MQHVMPRGFQRVRDYGFLHHNTRSHRQLVQWALRVYVTPTHPTPRPPFVYCRCTVPMAVIITGYCAVRAALYHSQDQRRHEPRSTLLPHWHAALLASRHVAARP